MVLIMTVKTLLFGNPIIPLCIGGTIGSITGGTFFKGKTDIAQNMTGFNAALAAGGTALTELPETATIMYKKKRIYFDGIYGTLL